MALLVVFAVVLAGVPAHADTLVPGSCVVVRGGGTPNPVCRCRIYQSSGNVEQDEYNIIHGYALTTEIYGPCVSYDCRNYRADQRKISQCYDYTR
ncbi:MAG TPA: hypothetical protein VFY29_21595 [Terriglobia bacterium]|nr:hypothetical protein [Terriglobia bacterium]